MRYSIKKVRLDGECEVSGKVGEYVVNALD